MRKHEVEGKRLSKHNTTANTFVYAPIKELQLEEIWYIINTVASPWGFDNSILFQIYSDASADDYECPTVVTNKKHSSCGQSRFGCWTCTVVKKDKSMSALIDNGQHWMEPLLKFRNSLVENRNVSENRSNTRRNGMPAVAEDGHRSGNYEMHYRARILRELLEIEENEEQGFFLQPCDKYCDGCSIYSSRPKQCMSFNCNLLESYEKKEVTANLALEIIADFSAPLKGDRRFIRLSTQAR